MDIILKVIYDKFIKYWVVYISEVGKFKPTKVGKIKLILKF